MQFDWTTFVLEVLNFLVLVWILKRFLYRPVLEVLDARQARVQDEMAQAARLQQEGASLRQQYEERLAHWAQEREQLRQQLQQELAQQRAAGAAGIRQSLADEEAKARVRNAAMTASHEAELVRLAAGEAYRNVAAMLGRLASPPLTASLVRLLVEDLAGLPEAQRASLRSAAEKLVAGARAEVGSAHALDDELLREIARGVSAAAGRDLPVTVSVEPTLIAGVRVAVGECLLHANLADELAFFRHQDGRG
ncbi:F0F1 ATP synthase subunit delta [Accumulibacter sp.]|uniref:F0F1 ATP synthase subunit delta n=1 Tax=Accumulibacter sp. TaxID=2053492 RepID=UPI0025F9328C|nr:F0F1 ATP synthase subunit delta [Accumulibacter sp.]MCP5227059.1 F0F1 ATP synthase subunit delta [Accumulibacter sp.]